MNYGGFQSEAFQNNFETVPQAQPSMMYGGFQAGAFQNDFETVLIVPYVSDPNYVVCRPYFYHFRNPKTPLDSVILTFNFSGAIENGEILTGFPTVTFANLIGGDPDPSALANGPALIDSTGTLILVPVQGGLDMNDYTITAEAATTNPQKILAWPGILRVRMFPTYFDGAP